MPNRDSYRNKAKTCVEASAAMRGSTERVTMLELAQGYLKLADHAAARHDRTARRKQADRHPEKQELERFGSTLRSVLDCPGDRDS